MITTHNKMLDELLDGVTTKDDLVNLIKTVPYMKFYMESAVDDIHVTIDLPEAKHNDYHRSMAGALLLNRATQSVVEGAIRNPRVTANVKRKQYMALSEMLFVTEAVILTAILTKNLESVYPTLTHEFICEALNAIE